MPTGYRWFRGGPGLSRAGRNALFAADDTQVWVWDEETGNPVTDLLDETATAVSAPKVVDGWVLGAGLPTAVNVASFSLGKDGKRYPLEPANAAVLAQASADAAASSASAAQASANSSAASAALVGAPAGSAIDAYLGGSASALLDASGNVQSGRSVVRGNTGKRYRVVACAIQNTGAPNYWQSISDAQHNPIVGTVTTSTSTITVNYGFTAAKVAALVVSPDEAMCWKGYEVGASVGLSAATLTLSRSRITDYVSYNGTSWSSLSGVFSSISFNTSTGVLSLTHDYIGGPVGQVTVRDGNIDAQLGSLGNTTTEVVFRDAAGTKLLTPSTAMRVYVTRVGWGSVNPQVSGLGAGENLWIHGLLEV
jgi:hypothetical protein